MNQEQRRDVRALIDSFIEVTGLHHNDAEMILSCCEYDLQSAINFYLEGGNRESFSMPALIPYTGPSTSGTSSSAMEANEVIIDSENDVRPPILPREDILIDSSAALALNRARVIRTLKRGPVSVFDTFRDFRVEGDRQEAMVANEDGVPERKKIRHLEDIFRPPLEMMFHGSFDRLRDAGKLLKKFIMVNIQKNAEFQCQVLNRDIWSNNVVKMLVGENFVFWQVFHDSEEGLTYRQFYPVDEYPYVAVIDPRTGELVERWTKISLSSFTDDMLQFLQNIPNPFTEDKDNEKALVQEMENFNPSTSKEENLQNNSCHETYGSILTCTRNAESTTPTKINAKVEENLTPENGSAGSPDKVPDDVTEDANDTCSPLPATSPDVDLCAGFDDASRKVWIRIQYPNRQSELKMFPAEEKLELLHKYLECRGYPRDKFQFVTYMPKRALNKSGLKNKSFDELDIKKDTVYIHPIMHEDDK